MGTDKKKLDSGYQLQSVEKSAPPKGMQDGEWHSYVLVRGDSEIRGVRFDTLKAVTQHALELAERINTRNGWNTVSYTGTIKQK